MREFNLEEAKAGKPVCTRGGYKVRIFTFDRKHENGFTIVGCIVTPKGNEVIREWRDNGEGSCRHETGGDLMMYEEELKHEFKPFDKVLVRDGRNSYWRAALFERMVCAEYIEYHVILDETYNECIPYEGNEHLLGTTNNP